MTEANVVEEIGAPEDTGGVVVALDPSAGDEEATPEAVPTSALVVVAHPDDADFGAAGTVATWTALGCRVSYCIVTDGSAGSADPLVDLSTLVSTRQREQREAARVVGVEEVEYLGYSDGQLEPTLEVRRDISRVIRPSESSPSLPSATSSGSAQATLTTWRRARRRCGRSIPTLATHSHIQSCLQPASSRSKCPRSG